MNHKRSLAFLAIVGVAFLAYFLSSVRPGRRALDVRSLATRALAAELAKTQPGKRLVVVSNPFVQRAGVAKAIAATEEAGLRGLREGWGNKMLVVFPELRPGAGADPRAVAIDPETTTPLSYLVAPDAFDRIVKAHPGCDILVSLIGLPSELAQCRAWQESGPPAFALLLPDLRMVGDTAAVIGAVKAGKLLAFVLRKPGAPGDQEPPGRDERAEFARRFLLVTRENIDEIAQGYPGLF